MRGIGGELALALELGGQAVEHVVERLGENRDLSPAARNLHPGLEFAGVDPRRDRGHPSQRRRHSRAGQVGRQQGERERQQAREHERPGDAVLGPGDDRQRLAGTDDDIQVADVHHVLEHSGATDVWDLLDRVAEVWQQQPPPERRLETLLGAALTIIGHHTRDDLRVVEGRRRAGDQYEQQRRRGAVRLRLDVVTGAGRDLGAGLTGMRSDGLSKLGRVPGDVAIDLGTHLEPGIAVDDEEDDRHRCKQHGGDPDGQAPAQSTWEAKRRPRRPAVARRHVQRLRVPRSHGRIEPVADRSHCHDRIGRVASAQFAPEVADVDIDDVGARVVFIAPDGAQDLFA